MECCTQQGASASRYGTQTRLPDSGCLVALLGSVDVKLNKWGGGDYQAVTHKFATFSAAVRGSGKHRGDMGSS